MFVFAIVTLAIHLWKQIPDDAFPLSPPDALDLGRMHFKEFLFRKPVRPEDGISHDQDEDGAFAIANTPTGTLVDVTDPADTHLIAPGPAQTLEDAAEQTTMYRAVVCLLTTVTVFTLFIFAFPFLFVLSYVIHGAIGLGGALELDDRGFFDRVHDVCLAMYWYVRADTSLQEGFYDSPELFEAGLLLTGVFQYPRLFSGKTFSEKRQLIDDEIREHLGPLNPPLIVTPVKALATIFWPKTRVRDDEVVDDPREGQWIIPVREPEERTSSPTPISSQPQGS